MPEPVGRETVTLEVNTENEQLVLATMMNDRVALRDLVRTLEMNVFLGKRHRTIFSVLQEIALRHLEYDHELFIQLGRDKSYGGVRYLNQLVDAFPEMPKNLQYHVDKLRIDAVKMKLRKGPVQRLVELCEDPSAELGDVSTQVMELNHGVSGHLSGGVTRGEALYRKYLADIRVRRKSSHFVPTGFSWLDENLTEGLAAQKVSIITARPSIGKSTLAWNIADRVANFVKLPVIYFPIEMGTVPVMDGMVSCNSKIHLDKLIKTPGQLTKTEARLVNDTAQRITQNKNLTFYDGKIALNNVYRVVSEGGYRVAVFDLWEKLVGSVDQKDITRELNFTQQLAKDTDCHFMLVQQTKRGVEKRDDKMPTLEDLKNSGTYEEVADLVIALTRRKFYQKDLDEDILEMEILKQRRGANLARVCYEFEGGYGRVGNERRGWGEWAA